jgi:hypothetical protein
VLSYFYQRCFFHNLPNQNNVLTEVLSVENIFPSNSEEFEKNKEILKDKIESELKIPDDENFEYFVKTFFDKWNTDEIDMDYVIKV